MCGGRNSADNGGQAREQRTVRWRRHGKHRARGPLGIRVGFHQHGAPQSDHVSVKIDCIRFWCDSRSIPSPQRLTGKMFSEFFTIVLTVCFSLTRRNRIAFAVARFQSSHFF